MILDSHQYNKSIRYNLTLHFICNKNITLIYKQNILLFQFFKEQNYIYFICITNIQTKAHLIINFRSGGGERDRTDDPLLAKQVLSQLSYTPFILLVGLGGLEPPTPRLSSVCSNQLSYRPQIEPKHHLSF